MGHDNRCKPVNKPKLDGTLRIGCSVCGTIWENGVPTTCPTCKRRVKNAGKFKSF